MLISEEIIYEDFDDLIYFSFNTVFSVQPQILDIRQFVKLNLLPYSLKFEVDIIDQCNQMNR